MKCVDMTPEQGKENVRTGLLLATVALLFFVGFVAKMIWFGR